MSERKGSVSYHNSNGKWPSFYRLLSVLASLLLGFMGVSCSSGRPTDVPSPASGVTPRFTSLVATPEPSRVAQPTPTQFDPTMPVTLTMWLPPEMAVSALSSGQAFEVINRSFHAANPSIFLEIVPKAAYGTGGLVNALLATRPVVPSRLPDIIAIDTAQVSELAAQDILVPLDDIIPLTVWQDLYPVLTPPMSLAGRRYAVPFQVDITFLAYNTSDVQISPRTWTDLEGSGGRYVFPAAQGDGSAADAFLLQYLAAGGQILNEGGQPYLDSSIMAGILATYRQAVDAGVVPISVRNLQTLDDCWSAYMQDKATMTNVGSSQYQREKGPLRKTRYAPIPTTSGVPATLARSWSWAIVTEDPVRQEMASRYLVSALNAEALANWCAESFHLPVHRAALALAVQEEQYRAFLDEQLQHAYPYPDLEYYTRLQAIIIRAIEDVLDGVSTPERAAVTAAATVARLR